MEIMWLTIVVALLECYQFGCCCCCAVSTCRSIIGLVGISTIGLLVCVWLILNLIPKLVGNGGSNMMVVVRLALRL